MANFLSSMYLLLKKSDMHTNKKKKCNKVGMIASNSSVHNSTLHIFNMERYVGWGPEFKARFSATAGWHFSRDLTRRLLIGGCGQSHVDYLLSMAEIASGSSFEPNKPREQKLGYV